MVGKQFSKNVSEKLKIFSVATYDMIFLIFLEVKFICKARILQIVGRCKNQDPIYSYSLHPSIMKTQVAHYAEICYRTNNITCYYHHIARVSTVSISTIRNLTLIRVGRGGYFYPLVGFPLLTQKGKSCNPGI